MLYLHVHVSALTLSLSLFQGGGGLKLTISKAVLKQAASQQKPAPSPFLLLLPSLHYSVRRTHPYSGGGAYSQWEGQ